MTPSRLTEGCTNPNGAGSMSRPRNDPLRLAGATVAAPETEVQEVPAAKGGGEVPEKGENRPKKAKRLRREQHNN